MDDKADKLDLVTTANSPENAISRIESLAEALVSAVTYSEELQEGFQQLSVSLVDLETNRRDLHDQLEIQTIEASMKRSALKTLPQRHQKDLIEAMLAARNSNAEVIQQLQSQMKLISKETEETIERQEILQMENTKFMPERDAVIKQHDEIIAALNQRMADKAGKQIKLNESRDLLRETSIGTEEFDLGMQNLEEDMAAFKAESQAEENDLQTDVTQVNESIVKQKEKNVEEKRAADQLLDRIIDMDGRLDIVRKDVRRIENSKARLEIQSIQHAETINREKLLNQKTAEEVAVIEGARDRQKIMYEEKLKEIEAKTLQAETQFLEVQEQQRMLKKAEDEACLKKEAATKSKAKAQASVRESAREVQVMKQKTTACIEKAAQLSQENTKFQEELEALVENHSVTVETFNQQIAEYKANLDIESNEKERAYTEQEAAEKVLDTFRSDQVRFMNDMTARIEEGRRQHKMLAKQSTEFHRSIANNVKRAKFLASELDGGKKGLEIMKRELDMEIERLRTNTELYMGENERKKTLLAGKVPVIAGLETELEEENQGYSFLKNEVVAIRNKEKSVQDQIKRTEVMLGKLASPQAKLKEDIKECRANNLEQLKEFGQERKQRESEIYNWTQKLEKLVVENQRFKDACESRTEIIDSLLMDIKAHGCYQELLLVDLRELERKFFAAWEVCTAMEKASAKQDADILQGIEELQSETKERCLILTNISNSLSCEMEKLTGFLENVNSRRPKDTRQDRRKRSTPHPPPVRSSTSLMGGRRRSLYFESQQTMPVSITRSHLQSRDSISQPAGV